MYAAQITKERVKSLCKNKKINMEQMLVECSLGVNAIRQINDAKGMASFSLAKIADYLECSVDYLLGRTDNPQIAGEIHISSDNGSISNIGNNANITVSGNNDVDKTTKEFTAIFSSLDLEDRFEVMKLLMEKRKK